MAITENQLKQALRDAVSAEFDAILSSTQVEHVFSERFEKKMQKLIKHERSPLWHLTNTGAKRALIVALAAVMLLSCACAIKPVREYIAGFFTELHDTYYDIFFKKETAVIEEEYYISSIPEGFELYEAGSFTSDAIITKRYINSKEDEIVFSQTITEYTFLTLDSEQGDVQEMLTINGRNIALYSSHNMLYAMWIEDGYLFELIVYGEYDKDYILTLVDSVTCK